MIEINCKYPIIFKDNEIIFAPDENGVTGSTYPGDGTSYKEFDTYEDAQVFIKEQGLKEPKASDDIALEV